MLDFYLPGAFELFDLNTGILALQQNCPEYFHENVNIKCVYGAPPSALWNGGRISMGIVLNILDIQKIITFYNQYDVGVRYTFTNTLLEEKHLQDTYCNLLCDTAAYSTQNECLVSTDILEQYLRTNYPKMPLASSITKSIKSKEDFIKELEKDYCSVVLPTQYSHDFEWLATIPNKDKVEILINCGCVANCPRKKAHYDFNSKIQLGFTNEDPDQFSCGNYKSNFYDAIKSSDFITFEDLETLVNLGFTKFKFEGRDACFNPMMYASLIEEYVYFLIKPEYQGTARTMLIADALDPATKNMMNRI